MNGWETNRVQANTETARLAHRAAVLGADDAVALCAGGFALGYITGDLDDGGAMTDQALVLNPNLAMAWLLSGYLKALLGEHEIAIEHLKRAMRLSPLDPEVFVAHLGSPLLTCSMAVMTKRRRGRKRHRGNDRMPRARLALPRQAMHSPDGWNKRRKRWHACARSIPRCGFPIFGMF